MDQNQPNEDKNEQNLNPLTLNNLLVEIHSLKTKIDQNKPSVDQNDQNYNPLLLMHLLYAILANKKNGLE